MTNQTPNTTAEIKADLNRYNNVSFAFGITLAITIAAVVISDVVLIRIGLAVNAASILCYLANIFQINRWIKQNNRPLRDAPAFTGYKTVGQVLCMIAICLILIGAFNS